jgi:rhodanese-related sulfurtransferase
VDTTVSAVEPRSRLAEGDDIRLVDVRTAAEFETGHIHRVLPPPPRRLARASRRAPPRRRPRRSRLPSGSRAALAAGAIVLTSVLTSLALPAASAVAGVVDVGLVVAPSPTVLTSA